MKLTTRILILAIVLTVALAAVVLLPSLKDDRLTVHLVDEESGKPINGRIISREYRPYPVLSSIKSLPPWLQGRVEKRSFDVRNGVFRVEHLANGQRREFEFRVDEFRTYTLECYVSPNGPVVFTSPKSQLGIKPGQTEISIPLYQP